MQLTEQQLERLVYDLISLLKKWSLWNDSDVTVYACQKRYYSYDPVDTEINKTEDRAKETDRIWIYEGSVPKDHLKCFCLDEFTGGVYLYEPYIDPAKHILSMTFAGNLYCLFNFEPYTVQWDDLNKNTKNYFYKNYPELFDDYWEKIDAEIREENESLFKEHFHGVPTYDIDSYEEYQQREEDYLINDFTDEQITLLYKPEPYDSEVTFDNIVMSKIHAEIRELFLSCGLWLEMLTSHSVCALTIGQEFRDIQLSKEEV